MLVTRQCLKCRHVGDVEDSPAAACPSCGAIYAKVEARAHAASTNGQARKPEAATARAPVSAPAVDFVLDDDPPARAALTARPFIDALRAGSNYPTFRAFVRFFYVVGLVLAVVMAIGAVSSLFLGSGIASFGAFFFGVVGAVVLALLARLFKETWLMLADAADAVVHLAGKE